MTEMLILRVIHVMGGIYWVGSAMYAALFVTPALVKAGPAAAPIMEEFKRRRLFTILPIVALLTMLSGARLLGIVSGGFSPAYFDTRQGLTFAVSGAASILAFVISLIVSRPSAVKIGAIAATLESLSGDAKAAALAQIAALRRRAGLSSAVAIWLLVLAAAGMSVARYL